MVCWNAVVILLFERVHLIEQERVCPDELKEAISGLLFASSGCRGAIHVEEKNEEREQTWPCRVREARWSLFSLFVSLVWQGQDRKVRLV